MGSGELESHPGGHVLGTQTFGCRLLLVKELKDGEGSFQGLYHRFHQVEYQNR